MHFPLFSLFFHEFTVNIHSFSAEILGLRAIEGRNNSGAARCFPLFLRTRNWIAVGDHCSASSKEIKYITTYHIKQYLSIP
jgi:hypothetical protein